MVLVHSLVASLLPLSVWASITRRTQPCHSGECHWELSNDSGMAMLSVMGSRSSISDLTSASGWTVLDCRDTDIRLVCHDPSKGCDHLYLRGAEHTLVRLPSECGSTPFAFVKREWTHEDQYIPLEKRSMFPRYDRRTQPVKGVRITTDYSEIDRTRHGRISLSFRGVGPFTRAKRSEDVSWGQVEEWIKKYGAHINQTKALDSPRAFELTDTARLYNTSFSCPQNGDVPAYSGAVTVDFTTTFNGSVGFGLAFEAELSARIPPIKFTHFSTFINMNATLRGTLDIDATLSGSLSTGKRSLGQIGIPGLDFPPFISIGPTLILYAEAEATLNTDVKLTTDLSYTFSDAQLLFPPSESSNDTTALSPGDAAISLSAGPNVIADTQLSVHITPTLSFGIKLLDGLFDTTVNLDVDASATADLSVTAQVDASVSESGEHNQTSAEWTGNADFKAGIGAHASADADIEGILDKDYAYPLFEKEWSLWSAQIGGSTSKRRAYIDRGDAVMSSYPDRILRKFTKDRGAIVPPLENLSAMSTVPGAQDAHGCLSRGPSSKPTPVLQKTIVPGSQ
ncbi:hypothetical protein C8Q80DRAFT_1135265 [Daedaleopsis nitida]|nr:hypothetical protein C8Q80DRAFT_1135265 [Daedaleopsis nitida]